MIFRFLIALISFFYIIESFAAVSGSLIFESIKSNNLAKIENIIQQGENVDKRGEFGQTPLMQAIYSRNNAAAKIFLKYGADSNATDIAGVTPLHIAARTGNLELTELLIRAGANINAVDKYNMTPLMKAIATNRNKVVEYLLKHSANKNVKDIYGYDALKIAQNTNNQSVIDILNNTKTLELSSNDNSDIAHSQTLPTLNTTKNFSPTLPTSDNKIVVKEIKSFQDKDAKLARTPQPVINKKIQIAKREFNKNSLATANQINDLEWLKNSHKNNQEHHIAKNHQPKVKSSNPHIAALAKGKNNKTLNTKRSKIKIARAKLISKEQANQAHTKHLASLKNINNMDYWMFISSANQIDNNTEISNQAVDLIRNYNFKYQVIRNLKNNKKYVKIGPVKDLFSAEDYCNKVLDSAYFNQCIVKKH